MRHLALLFLALLEEVADPVNRPHPLPPVNGRYTANIILGIEILPDDSVD